MAITTETIKSWIEEGRGQGHGTDYIPWIKIQTRGSPTLGNLNYRYIPTFNRYGHFLSVGEGNLEDFLLYLGVSDLREQFPCWPWKHPHPLYGHPEFNPASIPWSPGTLAIARSMGITHPRFPGTKLYHIPTIDVLATVPAPVTNRAVAFAVKPDLSKVEIEEGDAIKLALQRDYCDRLSIPWRLFSPNQIPETLSNNLRILFHYSAPAPNIASIQVQFADVLGNRLSASETIKDSLSYTRRRLRLSKKLGEELFHRALWFKQIPIDIRKAWVFGAPPILTDDRWISETRTYMLGQD